MSTASSAVVELRHHGELVPPRVDDVLVSVSVGPSGEAIALWSTAAGRDRLLSHGPEPTAARVVTYWPDPGPAVEIPELPLGFPTPAPRPDGQVLVVAARCQWRSSGPDHNAVVYDYTGQPILDGVFGDGIEHVYTTATGEAWVGYFDEGVFGNSGWGRPGPAPLGAPGIVRFDTDLRPQWSFPEPTSMADCYALNVDSWAVWACYYTDFPVARIVNGRVTHWANVAARGAKALLVSGTRCVLVGGYGPANRGRLVVGDLDREAFRPLEERRLDLPDQPVRLVGRSDQLHIFQGRHWYKVDTQL